MIESEMTTRLRDVAAASAAVMLDRLAEWSIRDDRGFEALQQALEATLYAFHESPDFPGSNATPSRSHND